MKLTANATTRMPLGGYSTKHIACYSILMASCKVPQHPASWHLALGELYLYLYYGGSHDQIMSCQTRLLLFLQSQGYGQEYINLYDGNP